ncbi:MAG TPA: ATP-binding protein [Pyrinomonadaceae bacterium]|nr:ATP-binding protein [Pyrinomonadaceae bacterium]
MLLRKAPIRRRLMTIILVTCGAVSLLTCLSFFAYEFFTFRQSTIASLSTLGSVLASNSTAALTFANSEDAAEVLSALRAEPHIEAASLYDENGKLFAQYPANLPKDAFPAAPERDGYNFSTEYFTSFQPVVLGPKRVGTLYLKSNLDQMYDRLRLYGAIVAVVMAASFALTYALSRILQGQISQPILALTKTARAVADRGDYSVRAPKIGEAEFAVLTEAFNQMLTRIHDGDSALRESQESLWCLNAELEQRVEERTRKLKEANKELEAFSYSVSHDLRAPLRAIDGFSRILLEEYREKFDEDGKRVLDVIRSNTQNMGRLIDDLLAFSRLSRKQIDASPVDMQGLASDVFQQLQTGFADQNIQFNLSPLPPTEGDPALIRQVFVNLLSNAAKYSRPRIQSVIDVSGHCENGDCVYYVKDNGVGFDMAYAKKLFGVFQRLHSVEEFEGTGVGLAIVQRIIHRHGGRVWAEGKVDEGATFFFSLPKENKQNGSFATAQ